MGKAPDKLTALLHNGQVGGKIGVEHIVKAHLLQGGHHALGRGELGVQMEVLSPGAAHGRRHLHHGDFLGVSQCVKYLAGIIALLQAAYGAVGDALAAEGAVGLAQGAGLGNADGGVGAGTHQIPDPHALHLFANLYAAHTFDAAVFHANHGVGKIIRRAAQVLYVVIAQQVIVVAQLLQLAVAAAGTLGAANIVLAEQQSQVDTAGLTHAGRIGMYHHALGHHIVARRHQAFVTFHLHHADTAGADLVQLFQIAQRGDIQLGRAGRLQNGGALRHAHCFLINCQCYHFSTRPPLKTPKPK